MKMIGVLIYLYDRKTGYRAVYNYEFEWYYYDDKGQQHGSSFIWEDGNYSCDCNRLDFIYPNVEVIFDITIDDDGYSSCVQEGYSGENGTPSNRIAIEKICLSDGTVVYSEEI